jgi:hypothetical protein
MPKWTRGQQAIKELATTTPRGCVVDVLLCKEFSGFSTIIDHLVRVTARPRKDQPVRVIGLQAQSYTHAVTSIVRMAGTRRNTQAGRLAGIWDALEAIHAEDPRPITFVLEDAHLMASADMERLIIALDYVCRQVACHCRCMLHCCHVSRWLQKEQMYTRVWPRLPERFVGWVDGRKVRHRGRVAVTSRSAKSTTSPARDWTHCGAMNSCRCSSPRARPWKPKRPRSTAAKAPDTRRRQGVPPMHQDPLALAVAIVWFALGCCALALAVVRLAEPEQRPQGMRRSFWQPLQDVHVILLIIALGPISATLISIAVLRDARARRRIGKTQKRNARLKTFL